MYGFIVEYLFLVVVRRICGIKVMSRDGMNKIIFMFKSLVEYSLSLGEIR